MPKVNEAHYEKKKLEILDAAKRVCTGQPIYSVTMRDIVIESGMSQGGVYKYFSNIDEVFVVLMNQNTISHKMEADVNTILSSDKDPLDILHDFFQYIGKFIQDTIKGNGKIYFELAVLYANEPQRFAKVKDQLLEVSNLEYLQKQLSAFILKQVAEKQFHPQIPLEDILEFIMTAISGTTHNAILAYNFTDNQRLMPLPNIDSLMKTLSLAVGKFLEVSNEDI